MKRAISRRRASGILGAVATTLLVDGSFAQSGDVTRRVTKLIVELVGVERSKVTPAANFKNDLGADSLDCVELTMAAEEEFNIVIPDEAAAKIRTVGEMIRYVETAPKAAPRPPRSDQKK
jgi:acyl carrier protein